MPAGALEEILDRLGVDTKETLIAPPDFRVSESHIAAVECSQMVVRDDGIAFTALVRHADIYLTTAEIPRRSSIRPRRCRLNSSDLPRFCID